MKLSLLSVALLLGACQAPQRASERAVLPVEPVATPAAEEAPALPRWTHSDRAPYAVRAWVRDLR